MDVEEFVEFDETVEVVVFASFVVVVVAAAATLRKELPKERDCRLRWALRHCWTWKRRRVRQERQ